MATLDRRQHVRWNFAWWRNSLKQASHRGKTAGGRRGRLLIKAAPLVVAEPLEARRLLSGVVPVTVTATPPINAYGPAFIVPADPIATATAITSSSGASTYGQTVTFTASVTPASGSGETGTVQFQIDGGNVGSPVTLSGNSASYATPALNALNAGSHAVVAVYSGDGNFAASTSAAFTQTVAKAIGSGNMAFAPAVNYVVGTYDQRQLKSPSDDN